jgi:hypothetical protein
VKRFILVFCTFLMLIIQQTNGQNTAFITNKHSQHLLKILSLFSCNKMVTPSMRTAKESLLKSKQVTEGQAMQALDDVARLMYRCPKIKNQIAQIQKSITALRGEIAKPPVKKNTAKPTSPTSHITKQLIVDKNIIFRPPTLPHHYMNAVGSFTEGVRILSGSMPFSQTESSKKILFATPFHDRPIVVFSLRYDDVTFATPVVSEVGPGGFVIKGLSLPPPESNTGFIDYIAVGI